MRRHIGQIDALRGLAALGVAAFYHVGISIGAYKATPLGLFAPTAWLQRNAWTFVDLFFVISGFVFAHVYLDRKTGRTTVSLGDFAVARFARLYPLHLATLLFMALLAVAGDTVSRADASHFVLNLAMLQATSQVSFNVPAWSISVECFCYVAFILAARTGKLPLTAASFIPFGIALTFYHAVPLQFIGRGFAGFFIGWAAWRFGAWTLILAPLALIPSLDLGLAFSLSLWPAILLLSLRSDFMSAAPFRWIGDRSYSIYLCHMPLYHLVHMLVGRPETAAVQWIVMGASVVLLLAVADLSYRLLEKPARRAIRSALEAVDVAAGQVPGSRQNAHGVNVV